MQPYRMDRDETSVMIDGGERDVDERGKEAAKLSPFFFGLNLISVLAKSRT